MSGRVAAAVSQYLALAATPVFTLMALISFTAGDARSALLCSQAQPFWLPTGMTPMYLLMSAFHLPAWLRPARLP